MSNQNQTNQVSPLDDHRDLIEGWLDQGLSKAEIVRRLTQHGVRTSRGSLNRAVRRWNTPVSPKEPSLKAKGFDRPGVERQGDTTTVVSEPVEDLKSAEELCEERGIDLDEWAIYDIKVNEWDGQRADDQGIIKQRQITVRLHRILPIEVIVPARPVGPVFTPKSKPTKPQGAETVVFVGDQQYPYNNPELEDAFLSWMNHYQPDRGILIGDTIDLPDISRHPDNLEQDATLQECVDAGYVGLRRYREASEDTRWQKLPGNHDERLRRIQIDKVRQAYGVRRGKMPDDIGEEPVLTVPHLLRLDELAIDYIEPNGDYEHAQVNVTDFLAARHGWIARKGSGASALATLEHLGYSVVVGHTHRQSIVHKTVHDINGAIETFVACETGCMCQIEGGLGYAVSPDWQNGWATATIWPSGHFRIELATYVDGVVYYRDQQFK